jgi:hypothetical protein
VRTQGSLGSSRDGLGTAVFTDRACWRQAASESEILQYQKRGISVTHKIYFTTDPGLDERHTIVMGSDTMEVRTYASPDASAGLGVLYRVMADMDTADD